MMKKTEQQKPIFDLAELIEEAKDRIEEKLAIEGGGYIENLQRH